MKLFVHEHGSPAPEFSIVLPVKDERENIAGLHAEIKSALAGRRLEIIYVDDGSTDGSLAELEKVQAADPAVIIVQLQKNYGKSSAYMAGFKVARGDLIATMDADLQDKPEDLLLLAAKLEQGFDLVIGWKHAGKSSFLTHLLSRFFNPCIRFLTGLKIHDMNCPLRVMRNLVADKLVLYGGLYRYIPLLAAQEGFAVGEVKVANRSRQHGHTKYTSSKYIKGFFDFLSVYFLTRFSEKPLHLFGSVGLVAFLCGFAIDLVLTLRFVLTGRSPQDDLPSLLLGILLIMLGFQLLSIGLLGDMMLRNENKRGQEDLYIIKKILKRE